MALLKVNHRVARGQLAKVLLSATNLRPTVNCREERLLRTSCHNYVKFSQLEISECNESQRKPKPGPDSKLAFGQAFTDHMFECEWTEAAGWGTPRISPFHNFVMHPAAKVLHYAQELFEGMKAFRGDDGKVRLFRPELNMQRMLGSADRMSFAPFEVDELIPCIKKLVELDKDWCPTSGSFPSLYIRPTMIGIEPTLGVASAKQSLLFIILSPVSGYFAGGLKPVNLIADPRYVRAWPGGCGNKKLGSNYGPTVRIQKDAEANGYQQVLWLFGEDHQITEIGTMNIFVHLINDKGEKELITPPLEDGIILPGVTRNSLLTLAREWNDFKVTERRIGMKEIKKALDEKRLIEVFGAGTACVVCPVGKITYLGEDLHMPTIDLADQLNQRFLKALTDIQYGKVPDHRSWAPIVC